MAHEDLNDETLEKLAWIIAEEFVDSCDLLSGLHAASERMGEPKPSAPKPMRMIFAWGNPAIALPPATRLA